mmetsp:Transcript_17927/g.42304  ORF Transcript_17927/g.42304 Transcript_17927/m.42304 type:complete len:335 (+) Transcript_17927:996-2000(+)
MITSVVVVVVVVVNNLLGTRHDNDRSTAIAVCLDGIGTVQHLIKNQPRLLLHLASGHLVRRVILAPTSLLVLERRGILQVDKGPRGQLLVLLRIDKDDDFEKTGGNFGGRPSGRLQKWLDGRRRCTTAVQGPRKHANLIIGVFFQSLDPIFHLQPFVLIEIGMLQTSIGVHHGIVGGPLGLLECVTPRGTGPIRQVTTIPIVVLIIIIVELVLAAHLIILSPRSPARARFEPGLIDIERHANGLPTLAIGGHAVVNVTSPSAVALVKTGLAQDMGCQRVVVKRGKRHVNAHKVAVVTNIIVVILFGIVIRLVVVVVAARRAKQPVKGAHGRCAL